ncbi:unnamed protein product [Musa textilis]
MLPLCSRVLLSHPFSPMSLMALREQLNMLVNSMYIEGLLDQQFQQLQMLQDASSPGFVAEVINLFCEDAERILTELTKDQAVVDFQKVDAYVHQLKGSSSSVGAQNVKLACIQFRQFCEENNKDGCLNALNVVKHHYYLLRNKFDTMLQVIFNLFKLLYFWIYLFGINLLGMLSRGLIRGRLLRNRTEQDSSGRSSIGKRTWSGRVDKTECCCPVRQYASIRTGRGSHRGVKTPTRTRERSRFSWLQEAALPPFSSSVLLRLGGRSHRPLPGRHCASGGGGDIDTRRLPSYTTPFH